MKVHTTNYKDTLIQIADDCPAAEGTMPPIKGDARSVANMQFDMIYNNPYKFTSDDILFQIYAERNGVGKNELEEAREQFFSKGQPCLRTSPLAKRYGWGIHSNSEEKVALYGSETEEYKKLVADERVKRVKAMRASR